MNIIHIADDLSNAGFGVATVVNQQSNYLAKQGIPINIGYVRNDPIAFAEEIEGTQYAPAPFSKRWGWSAHLMGRLGNYFDEHNASVVHIHGVWLAIQWFAAQAAQRQNIPFVLTEHGMLSPWLWHHKGSLGLLKKTLYWRTLACRAFRHATVIHALTDYGKQYLAELFPQARIEVIPNGISLELVDQALQQLDGLRVSDRPYILFMGRLDSQKGIDLLIQAFARAQLPQDWQLLIAGPYTDRDYQTALLKQCQQSHITERVQFLGGVYGLDKWKLYQQAHVVAAPSRFEGVSMVNLESSACSTPTITTRLAGVSHWEQGGGIIIDADADQLATQLKFACSWTDRERLERGKASRQLIESYYDWNVVIQQWLSLYHSLTSD
jgi:glycosyltransferase involved in cell wall biosynthesis